MSIKGNSSNDSKSAKKHGSDGLLFFLLAIKFI